MRDRRSTPRAREADPEPRTFVALMLPDGLARSLLEAFLGSLGLPAPRSVLARGGAPDGSDLGLRFYGVGDLHATLAFLGPTGPDGRRAVVDALAGALAGRRRPRLVIDRTGAFPERGRERVLWAGAREEGTPTVAGLQRAVVGALAPLGFEPDERPFALHVTLARVRAPRRHPRRRPARGRFTIPDAFHELRPRLDWTPEAVSLVVSRPPGAGTAYEVVERFALDA